MLLLSPSSSHKSYYSIVTNNSLKREDASLKDNNDGIEFINNDFTWTPEEEVQVLNILDKYLMVFILIMTFVLNMDRTNICKLLSEIVYSIILLTNNFLYKKSKCHFRQPRSRPRIFKRWSQHWHLRLSFCIHFIYITV